MATGGDPGAALQDETTCSICLDYFQDPLMIIDCGHNFCRACITRDSGGGGSDLSVSCCPVCRKPFSWDNLRANRLLGNVAEVIQQFRLQRLSEAEGVQKVCWEHKEVFELFCREDQAFICLACKESQAHKPHAALPIDQAGPGIPGRRNTFQQDQIQNHMTFLQKERDEILKMKIGNEKVIKETMRSVIYIREQKECAFPKEVVHTVLALLRDIEEKTVQMADENASDALEHSAHLTQLIREMEAKCLQPAFEFLQDIGAFLSKCEREMARKPKAELRMTADSILQKLQLVQRNVAVFQRRKSSRLVRSRLLSLQAGLCNFLYDSPGAERGWPSGFDSPSAPAGHSSLALLPWPSRNKEDKEKRLTEFSILVGSNRTTDEDKSKRVQGFGSTKEMDQSQVKPSSSEVSDAGERKAQAVTATTAALKKAGRSKTPELFPVLLLPVMQASLRHNQMPPGHVQLSTADLHRSDLEAAGSSGSHSPALRGSWKPLTVLSWRENSLLNGVTLCSRRFHPHLILPPPEPLILAPTIEPLTFDAETAHPHLVVSRSGKSVRWGQDIQQGILPGTPRFSYSRCLLSNQGFASRHHFWVVEVDKEGPWAIGVALESVPRKRPVNLIPKEGIWAMAFSNGRYLVHTSRATPLTLSSLPRVIQVHLHYENGQVVFMDFYSKTVLCAFLSASFSGQKVHAFFRVGGPSAHLRLCCMGYLARLRFP